jgi:hypothetical protein
MHYTYTQSGHNSCWRSHKITRNYRINVPNVIIGINFVNGIKSPKEINDLLELSPSEDVDNFSAGPKVPRLQ